MRRVAILGVALLAVTSGGAVASAGPSASVVAAAAPAWKVVPSPSPPLSAVGSLQGIACPTATRCVVVGNYVVNTRAQPFVGQFDGTHWDVIPGPVPTDVADQKHATGRLLGVACPGSTKCFAVGNYDDGVKKRTLIEQWDGTKWAIASRPRPSTATSSVLSDIACPTSTACFAVGAWRSADGRNRSFVARWNGKTWAVVPSPNVGDAHYGNQLAGISCVSATRCFAVGSYARGSQPGSTLIERWDGKTWSLGSSPNPATAPDNSLADVSCLSISSCLAVGTSHNAANKAAPDKALVERWNGTRWSVVAAAAPAGGSYLNGISCVAADSCLAVGGAGAQAAYSKQSTIQRWNGNAWSVVDLAPVGEPLNAIRCRSRTSCVAIGGARGSIAAVLGGTSWTITGVGGATAALSSISCSSVTSCFALGSYPWNSPYVSTNPLLEQWDGKAWSVLPTFDPGPGILDRYGFACAGSTTCFMIGFYDSSVTDDRALIVRWNGTSWSEETPLTLNGTALVPSAISCVDVSTCFAFGSYFDDVAQTGKTFAERWNGTAWSIVSAANPAGQMFNTFFPSVACVSATSCIAVGKYSTDQQNSKTLVEQWDGTRWTIVPSPNPAGRDAQLSEVTCWSPTGCLARGEFWASDGSASGQLLERWDGTAWSIAPNPVSPGNGTSRLPGMSCLSATTCFAVGYQAGGGAALVERWDGTRWTIVTTPKPARATYVSLSDVACVPGAACFAVGYYGTHVPILNEYLSDSSRTLVERDP